MRICYDTLENLYLTRNGNFKKGNTIYIEKEHCIVCNESYLMNKYRPTNFCGHPCKNKDENHPSWNKKRSIKSKQKMAESAKNRPPTSKSTRNKLSILCTGDKNPMKNLETRKKISKITKKRIGRYTSNWKGGVTELGVPFFDTFSPQISYVEETRRDTGNCDWLQVKCAYCGVWYIPKTADVRSRIEVLAGQRVGEARFYCSKNCKQACPIYRQVKYPKGFKHATSREVDPNLRQMVLERDNWTCQICGKTVEETELHCHHMDPAAQNPMFQNDMDSCTTLCCWCHNWIHSQYGCRYVDLRCNS